MKDPTIANMIRLPRRALLTGGASGFSVGALGAFGRSTAWAHGSRLFSLGVASGDPGAFSVVLWSRLAPAPLEGGGMPPHAVPVRWQVALDPHMRIVIRSGVTFAMPQDAHTVRVTAEGLLPDRWYYYRFHAQGEDSPIGRTRTFPLGSACPRKARFGLVSCQDYQNGLFSAYAGLANEDLDFVIHLGDYIYEYAGDPTAVRQHVGGETQTLTDYRNRYAQYRLDPALQAAHAAFPFITTFDDHEVENNYAGGIPEEGQDPVAFKARRASAYKAYFEHLPLRERSRPTEDAIALYRRLRFGRLASFHVLDTRQFRTDQPCDDGLKPACAGVFDPTATMLGAQQEEWLNDGLSDSRSVWNVIAQQVMFMRWDIRAAVGAPVPFFNVDAWDGYAAARQRLLDFLAAKTPANPVILSGDIHSSWAADINEDQDSQSGIVASEFVGTSITSDFPASFIPLVQATLPSNPHIKYFEGGKRGYVKFQLTPERLRAEFRYVDSILTAVSPVKTLKTFEIKAGYAGLIPA